MDYGRLRTEKNSLHAWRFAKSMWQALFNVEQTYPKQMGLHVQSLPVQCNNPEPRRATDVSHSFQYRKLPSRSWNYRKPAEYARNACFSADHHFGKLARKQNLMRECQDSLYRMYTIPSVSVVDCFQESRQQVKCCLQMVTVNNSQSELSEALKLCVVKLFIGCNGISDQAETGNDSGSSVPGNEGPDHQRF
nr:uncharacterized protein LOC109430657 isoform X2 [Aedes albopictus]